jgi:predicted PolB exonuclease-like 3'-5' exonuclease
MILTLDCETAPSEKLKEVLFANINAPKNYKDEAKIKEYVEAKKFEATKTMSIDPDYNEIKCIGVKIDDKPAKLVTLKELGQLLKEAYTWVTFNGKNFDLPTIIKNGLKLGIDLPYKDLNDNLKKWRTERHVDLMELISQGRDYKSLDEYAQIYFGEKKEPIDFSACTQEELERHCLADTELTYKLYLLFKPLL